MNGIFLIPIQLESYSWMTWNLFLNAQPDEGIHHNVAYHFYSLKSVIKILFKYITMHRALGNTFQVRQNLIPD